MGNSRRPSTRDLKRVIPHLVPALPEQPAQVEPQQDFTGLDPLHDFVLIRRDRRGQTAGGLFVPESAKDTRGEATVLAAGPGKWSGGGFVATTVKTGDRVMVRPDSDIFVVPDESAVCLVREADIIARFRASSEAAPQP